MPTRHDRCTLIAILCALLAAPTALHAQAPQPAPAPAPAVRFSGYLQVRQSYQDGSGLATSLNRVRLGAAGSPAPALSWKILTELRTGAVGTGRASVSLQDAFARYQRGVVAVQAGQFKTPFAREFLLSITDLETPNRALVVDALAPKRDLGAMLELGVGLPVTLSAGAFNGEGVNLTANRDSTILAAGRLAGRPRAGVEIGANVAAFGGDSVRYGADAGLRLGRLALRGEYLRQRRDGGIVDDAGWYALAGVRVTRPLQLVARYEELQQREAAEPVDARAWTAGGVVELIEQRAKLTFAVTGREDRPVTGWVEAAIAQLQLRF